MSKLRFLLPIFIIGFIALLITLFPNKVEAGFSHKSEYVTSYTDTDGFLVETHNLYLEITGNTIVNQVEGNLLLTNLEVVDFVAHKDFVEEFDGTHYKLTSNREFNASDGKLVYATVTVKHTSLSEECYLRFEPTNTAKVNTNNFTITKEAYQNNSSVSKVYAGDEFDYRIIINGDNAIASDSVVVTDTIPDTLEIISAPHGSISGQTITWNLGSFQAGKTTKELTVRVRAKETSLGSVNNTAVLTVGDKTISDDVTVQIVNSKISITKVASKSSVNVGEEFYYTITLKNTGTAASKDIVVEDTLSDYLTFIKSDVNYSLLGKKITFNIGSLDINETYAFKVYVKASYSPLKPSLITNTVIATEEEKEPISDEEEVSLKYPNLVIKKEVSNNEVKRGNTFNYIVTVSNNGDGDAYNVAVSDVINNNFTILNTSMGTFSNNKVAVNLGTVKAKESKSFTITVRVLSTAPLQAINNIVVASADNNDEISDEEVVNITDSNLIVSKLASKSVLTPGEEFNYTIAITNNGTAVASGITVSDVIDSNLLIVDSGNATKSGNTLSWTINSLAVGAKVEYVIKVKVKESAVNNLVINNKVVVKETNKSEITDEVDVVVKRPILTIEKEAYNTHSLKLVKPNEEFNYRIKVSNNGEVASDKITIVDNIHSLLTIVDADGGIVNKQEITWVIDSLLAGESKTFIVKVKLNADAKDNTDIKNIAVLTHKDEKLEDDDTVTVVASDVYIKKIANKELVKRGEEFSYTISIGNVGSIGIDNLVLKDSLPSKLELVNFECPSNIVGIVSDNNLVFNIPKIDAEEVIEIKVNVKVIDNVKKDEIIKNTAVLTYEDKELESIEEVKVIDTDVYISKSSNKEIIANNEEFIYTITVTNKGTMDATNLEIVDIFDEHLKIIDSDGGSVLNNNITWLIPFLGIGESKSYQVKVKVDNVKNNTEIINKVTLKEPDKPDKSDEVKVKVLDILLDIKKSVSDNEVLKDKEFIYTITVTNKNDLYLSNVKIIDELSMDLSIVEAIGALIDNNTIIWECSLNPKETKELKIVVKVNSDSTAKTIENKAYIDMNQDIYSNIVEVLIVDIENPQTGKISNYLLVLIGSLIMGVIWYIYKKKNRIYKI